MHCLGAKKKWLIFQITYIWARAALAHDMNQIEADEQWHIGFVLAPIY